MATINQQKPIVVRGGRIEYFPVAAAQTIYRGQFCYLDSYGRATVCSSNASVTVGMSVADSSSQTVNTQIPIYVPDEDTIFELNVIHSTPASATIVKSLLGTSYNYTSASYGCYVNRSYTTTPFFHVEAMSPKDAENDLFGRLWCTVVPEVRQVGGDVA